MFESVHTRATESHPAETRRATTEEKARRIWQEALDKLGWTGAELALRAGPAVTLQWIATEWHLGTWTPVANRRHNANGKNESNHPAELDLV